MKVVRIYIDDYFNARKALIATGDKIITIRLDNMEISIDRPGGFGRRIDAMMREVKPEDPKYKQIIDRYKELMKVFEITFPL